MTASTCGTACWTANPASPCVCWCEGRQHGITRRDADAQPERTMRRGPIWYRLVATAESIDDAKAWLSEHGGEVTTWTVAERTYKQVIVPRRPGKRHFVEKAHQHALKQWPELAMSRHRGYIRTYLIWQDIDDE